MPARAIWKGVLHVGSQRVPVKLYSAVEERGVHFRLLHERSRVPVRQQLVDPESGEIVPYADVRRGFAVPEGYVILKKDELDQLAPEASRDVAIERFVPTQKLGPEWHVRPYYLEPDGEEEAYFAEQESDENMAEVIDLVAILKKSLGQKSGQNEELADSQPKKSDASKSSRATKASGAPKKAPAKKAPAKKRAAAR